MFVKLQELEAAPRQAAAPPTLTPSSTLASIPVEKRSKKNDGEYHSSVDLSMSTVRRALGKLRAQQASHDQNMAKIALQDTKRAFDQASDRLERAETEIKTLKKHSQDLTQTIETDTNLMETHNKAHKQLKKIFDMMSAIAASDDAIRKLHKACQRAKIEEAFQMFTNMPFNIGSASRIFVLTKQLECLQVEAKAMSTTLKTLMDSRRKKDREAKSEMFEACRALRNGEERLQQVNRAIRSKKNAVHRIQQRLRNLTGNIHTKNKPKNQTKTYQGTQSDRDHKQRHKLKLKNKHNLKLKPTHTHKRMHIHKHEHEHIARSNKRNAVRKENSGSSMGSCGEFGVGILEPDQIKRQRMAGSRYKR
ncbi:hypothetical protein AAMO2058_001134600 [Amorphochlora amoebiformis]